jgi:starch phosphorylase
MSLAERLVQGVDLWINTPRRPWEACGTSGMKVLVNGGLNLSELDGWWAEAYSPQVGWSLGDGQEHDEDPAWDAHEAEQLYAILEQQVVPAFYNRDSRGIPKEWISRIRLSMAELTPRFSSNRMLREYVEHLYLPAASLYSERIADGAENAKRLCEWSKSLEAGWHNLRFGDLTVSKSNGNYDFKLPLYLEGIDTQAVRVELYAETEDGGSESFPMEPSSQLSTPGRIIYRATIPARRKASDYTPRAIPVREGALVPLEANQILWYEHQQKEALV